MLVCIKYHCFSKAQVSFDVIPLQYNPDCGHASFTETEKQNTNRFAVVIQLTIKIYDELQSVSSIFQVWTEINYFLFAAL